LLDDNFVELLDLPFQVREIRLDPGQTFHRIIIHRRRLAQISGPKQTSAVASSAHSQLLIPHISQTAK
jgi:hypothetical protein